MKIKDFPEELKAFVIDAILLDNEESVTYYIGNDKGHCISATADEDGYNIELITLINYADDITENVFVEKGKEKEIPTVIEYLTNCI